MRLACGVVVLAALAGCSKAKDPGAGVGSSAVHEPTGPHVTLRFAYSSEKKAWLDQVLWAFALTHPKTPSGKEIVVDAKSFGSGEASAAILDGTFAAHVYSPASTAYLALLNDQWRAKHGKPIATTSEPLVLSPIVIAMWKPMAEALGWPKKDIGWADIIKVSQDPKGWASLKHPEWGASSSATRIPSTRTRACSRCSPRATPLPARPATSRARISRARRPART